MSGRSDYYERLNFILQENINKRGVGGNWWLADTCNEGIVCMGGGGGVGFCLTRV